MQELRAKCVFQTHMLEIITVNSASNVQMVDMVDNLLHRYWNEDRHSLANIMFALTAMFHEKSAFTKKAISIFKYYLPIDVCEFKSETGYHMTNDKSRLKREEPRDMLKARLNDEWTAQKAKLASLSQHKKKAATEKTMDEMTGNEVAEARQKAIRSISGSAKKCIKMGLTKQQAMDAVSVMYAAFEAEEVKVMLKEVATGS